MRQTFKLLVLTLAIASALAFSLTPSEARTVDVSLELPFPTDLATCVDCALCFAGGDVGHKAYEGDASSIHARGGGTHEWCSTGAMCSEKHPITYPNCDGDASEFAAMLSDLEHVRVAIVRGQFERAIEIAEQTASDRLAYVPDRNAIQAAGCNGALIAHLPLE